jgi:hypothetical protein
MVDSYLSLGPSHSFTLIKLSVPLELWSYEIVAPLINTRGIPQSKLYKLSTMCSLFYKIFRPYIYHHCHLSSLHAAAVFFDVIHNNPICSSLQLSIDFSSPDLNGYHLMTFWTYFDITFPGMLQLTTLCISFDEDDYTSIHVWKGHLSGHFPPLLNKVHLKSFGRDFATLGFGSESGSESGSGSDSELLLDGSSSDSELPPPRSKVSIRNCLSMLF